MATLTLGRATIGADDAPGRRAPGDGLGTMRAVVGDAARNRLLVERVVAGDDVALGLLYDDHAPFVFTLALRVCRDRGMAEDVTQDVFVHVWERADDFDPERASLRTWLAVLTHRRSVDRIRREEARRRREDRDHQRTPVTTGPAVDDDVLRSLASAELGRALAALPGEQRRCIELAYFEGRTFREVAADLGIPEGTAKSRIRLALAKLAEAVEDHA